MNLTCNTPAKSDLFRAYNLARTAARKGGAFDRQRLNRALGILQTATTGVWAGGFLDYTNEEGKQYRTTLKSCNCPDRAPYGWCKHKLALALIVKIRRMT